jgi:NAD(P)-dependent dehydrogenase (short-subunit alcohol dehydrogenase family)
VAIVTGGSFGIGRATALAFAKKRPSLCGGLERNNETIDLIKIWWLKPFH